MRSCWGDTLRGERDAAAYQDLAVDDLEVFFLSVALGFLFFLSFF
jgi:hypothetical protein